MKALLVEDDVLLREMLSGDLRRANFVVDEAETFVDAACQLEVGNFELLLIDWNLPDGSGIDLIAAYRAAGGRGGVIVITARRALDDRVAALDRGADDVLVKPFALAELRARIRALRRRPEQWSPEVYTVGNLVVDSERQSAWIGTRELDLTPKEWLLLRSLARQPGRLVPRVELVGQVWDENHEPEMHALDVHMCNLRAKLSRAGAKAIVRGRRGVGYQLFHGVSSDQD